MVLGCWLFVFEYESNCLHKGLGTIGGMLSGGSPFLRDPSPYLWYGLGNSRNMKEIFLSIQKSVKGQLNCQ